MSRGTFRYSKIQKRCLPLNEWLAEQAVVSAPSARSDLPMPMIISDATEIRSMADGKVYDSKAAYYASLKAHGCEIVGNMNPASYVASPVESDKQHEADIAVDVKRAIEEVSP